MDTKYNQLRLGNRKHMHEYSSTEDFYRMVLNAWRGEYPDGHIDYMRFMMDWTRLSGREMYDLMTELYTILEVGPEWVDHTIVTVDWNEPERYHNMLKQLMHDMVQGISPNSFDARAFDKAFNKLFNINSSLIHNIKKVCKTLLKTKSS